MGLNVGWTWCFYEKYRNKACCTTMRNYFFCRDQFSFSVYYCTPILSSSRAKQSFFQNTISEATNLDICVSFRWGRDYRSNIISAAKVIPLKEFVYLYWVFCWQKCGCSWFIASVFESSVDKSVATVDSLQAFLSKFVAVFIWSVVSDKLWSLKIYVRLFLTVSWKIMTTTN